MAAMLKELRNGEHGRAEDPPVRQLLELLQQEMLCLSDRIINHLGQHGYRLQCLRIRRQTDLLLALHRLH